MPRALRLLLLTPLLCLPAMAQQPAHTDPQLRLDVVVNSKDGTLISGLQQTDFTLLDNNTPQPITSFRQVTKETPVEIILVVDALNTPFSTVSYERQEVDKFLTANAGHLPQPITLAILMDKGIQVQGDGTRDGNLLAKTLDAQTIGLRDVGRSAGFYGAEERLGTSLQSLSLLISREGARPGRKLVIFVSPGWPALSGVRVDLTSKQQQSIFAEVVQFSTQLRQARVTMYYVDPLGAAENLGREDYYTIFVKGIAKPSQVDAGDLALQVLATQTGGLVLQGSNDTSSLIQRAVNDASPFYELTFAPPPGDRPNEYHALKLKLAQPDEAARTRQGYYAQPIVTP